MIYIFSFISDIKRWNISLTKKHLKNTGESLMCVCYGTTIAARGDSYDMEILMRKTIYDRLICGELYLVHTGIDTGYVHPQYPNNPFVLADIDGNIIPPINSEIY